ncbi:MAG: hypothetical protein HKN92_06025 [Chitinophagales bacterium]|nr:hypothetical protein [Chitinophagales bacterium]
MRKLDAYILKRMVFSFILLDLAYRYFSSALFHDLSGAVIPFTSLDLLYIGFHILGFPQKLMTPPLGIIFDLLLILSAIISIFKVEWRWPTIACGLLLFIYMIVFNSYTNHHYHSLIGVILMTVPFYFKSEKSMSLSWQSVRYYFIFIFVSASLWKLFRGAIFDGDHMVAILKEQHLLSLADNSNVFIEYLISHSHMSQLLFISAFTCQFLFVFGLFSRKFDFILLILLLIFMTMNLIVMHVFSFELMILGLTLIFTPIVRKNPV